MGRSPLESNRGKKKKKDKKKERPKIMQREEIDSFLWVGPEEDNFHIHC